MQLRFHLCNATDLYMHAAIKHILHGIREVLVVPVLHVHLVYLCLLGDLGFRDDR